MNRLLEYMIVCLILTIIIEVIVSLILKVKKKNDILNIILVNILTNPIVVTVPYGINIFYGLLYRNIILCILEILTVFVEGYIYKKYLKFNKINPYLLSLILNLSSYLIGLVLSNIIW